VDEPMDCPWAETPARTVEGTETILLVEDETGVRRLMGKVLEGYGDTILPARDAEDAMAIEERYAGQIHLMVSDMIMPGLSGPDLAQRIVPRRPSMQVLLVSGYVSRESIDLSMRNHATGFLQKPFTPETLATTVRERLDRRGPAERPPPPIRDAWM
jgi:DNA-binding NtrC family response regulator